ncbi:MAG: SH3 domain-containing protein [Lachnospiraceae bacterium]|nr:SH3 domain-containing protein [Lachnospiraceae bacterium]
MKKLVTLALCVGMAVCLTACSNNVEVSQEDNIAVTTESGVGTEEKVEEALDKETEKNDVKSSADAISASGKADTTESGAKTAVTASGAKTTESGAEEVAALTNEDGISTKVDMAKVTMFDEAKIMYAQTNVNMRTGPSTDYEGVGNIKTNTEVRVLGRFGTDGWYLVENGKGKAFVSNSYLGEDKIDLEALRAEQEAAALAAIEKQKAEQTNQVQDNTQQQTQAVPPQPVAAPAGILFIGDSRCVQMQAAVGGGNSSWICENAKGYEWFSNKAVGQADACIGKGTKVVICLGVNDTDNIYNYAALVNAKAAEWAARGAKTYYVSVNPVTENPYRTEEEVEAFNATLPGQLSGVKWIDTHSFLVNNGYTMVDGLHYDTNTYVAIFNAIVGSLK